MAKHDALREFLVAALPELARNPDKLLIYMTGGRLMANYGDDLGFQYKATLQVDVLDFPGQPAQFFLPLILWLKKYEPAILQAQNYEALKFDIDLVDNGAVDITIQLPMSEAVDFLPREGSPDFDMILREEPPIAGEELIIDPAALLKRIYHDGELLVGTPAAP